MDPQKYPKQIEKVLTKNKRPTESFQEARSCGILHLSELSFEGGRCEDNVP